MANIIRLRRDSGVNLSSVNPILQDGELAYDETRKLLKIGNGVNNWNQLVGLAGAAVILKMPLTSTALQTSMAHGMGGRPLSLEIYAECKVAALGYSVGDLARPTTTNNICVSADSTNLYISKSASNSSVGLLLKGGGSGTVALASWDLILVAKPL